MALMVIEARNMKIARAKFKRIYDDKFKIIKIKKPKFMSTKQRRIAILSRGTWKPYTVIYEKK